MSTLRSFFASLLIVPAIAACSASGEKGGGSVPLGDASAPDSGGLTLDATPFPEEGGLGSDALAGETGGPEPEAAIYAHSASTLYRLDPDKLEVIELGAFQNAKGGSVGDMTDIALDKDGQMFGVTFNAVWKIEYKSGAPKCTQLATLGQMFNGLTMVPAGTIEPDKEVLIGIANNGDWHRVDVAPGATSATVTKLGNYGSGHTSSGDSVGIIGDAVYSTTKNGFTNGDHVITVDPKTGKMIKDIGNTGIGDAFGSSGLYGVGYWGGVMYGFASDGNLYKIDLKTAKATLIPIKNKPSGGWWGAGVTTRAPSVIK